MTSDIQHDRARKSLEEQKRAEADLFWAILVACGIVVGFLMAFQDQLG